MESVRLNDQANDCEHGRYHAVVVPENLVYQFKELSEFDLVLTKSALLRNRHDGETETCGYSLGNGVHIVLDEGSGHYIASSDGVIYYPLYDVQPAVDETYSLYEVDDRLGFITLNEHLW